MGVYRIWICWNASCMRWRASLACSSRSWRRCCTATRLASSAAFCVSNNAILAFVFFLQLFSIVHSRQNAADGNTNCGGEEMRRWSNTILLLISLLVEKNTPKRDAVGWMPANFRFGIVTYRNRDSGWDIAYLFSGGKYASIRSDWLTTNISTNKHELPILARKLSIRDHKHCFL